MSTSPDLSKISHTLPAQLSYEILMDAAPLAIILLDKERTVRQWNPAAEQMFGWKEEEVLGRRHRIVPPEIENEYRDQQEKVFSGQKFEQLDSIRLRKDGRRIPVSLSMNPVKDAEGTVVAALAILMDITARKQVEFERDKIFSLSLDLLCVATLDGFFKRVNPAFERTLQYSSEELCSRSFFDFIHPDDREITLAELQKLGTGHNTVYFVNRYICKDGSVRYLSWTCPAAVPGDELLYAVARDITERRVAAAEREKLIAELTEALANVKTLQGLLPICASCKMIRDDEGKWNPVETYMRDRSSVEFTHGICPGCTKKLYPDYYKEP